MSFVSIRVLSQYRENYGDSVNPRWKMKGGVEFEFKNVDDSIMYVSKDEMDRVIGQILTERSNDMCSYELISWELIFGDPVILSTKVLMTKISEVYH
jgi:hypothetical protein